MFKGWTHCAYVHSLCMLCLSIFPVFAAAWQVHNAAAQYSGGQAKQTHVMSELSKPWE